MSPLSLAALAVALLLLVLGLFLGYPRSALARGALLTRKEHAIIAAFADTLFPAGGPTPLSGTEAGAVASMARYVAGVSRAQQLLIRPLFQFVEHAPWIFGPRHVR